MADNEVHAVLAANDTTSPGSSTGPAEPLGDQSALLHGRGGRRNRPASGVSDRVTRQQQLPRWFRSWGGLLRESGAERLPRLPRVPQGARPQLRPAVALGAIQVAGGAFHLCMTPQSF